MGQHLSVGCEAYRGTVPLGIGLAVRLTVGQHFSVVCEAYRGAAPHCPYRGTALPLKALHHVYTGVCDILQMHVHYFN